MKQSKNDKDDRSDRTPWQCKKQACAYQYCISKNSSYRPDAVQFCRHPYYTSYQECIERINNPSSATGKSDEIGKNKKDNS
jgi:hypothetical protein